MSIQAMVWVLEKSAAEKGARLVLLSIANHAKADGTGAWPSIAQVAREARLSQREVYYAKNELITLGELAVESCAGPKGTNLYCLPKMQGSEHFAGAKSASCKGRDNPCKTPPKVLHTGADEPSKSEPSTTEPSKLVPISVWLEFVDMRKKIRKPMTARAVELIQNELRKLQEQGEDVVQVVEQSIRNCWQDVFPVRKEKANGTVQQPKSFDAIRREEGDAATRRILERHLGRAGEVGEASPLLPGRVGKADLH